QSRAAIFDHAGFIWTVAPAEQPAFVNRIERVDERMGAAQRNAGRDATVAKHAKDIGLGRAREARLRQPCRQVGKEAFIHARTLLPQERTSAQADNLPLPNIGTICYHYVSGPRGQ